jgi:hypothetical protein
MKRFTCTAFTPDGCATFAFVLDEDGYLRTEATAPPVTGAEVVEVTADEAPRRGRLREWRLRVEVEDA